jgi:histidinol-phosphate aminotransferase
MNLTIPEYILSIKPYKPGKPLEELEREYGIKDSIKLASNENPLGPSPKAVAAIQSAMQNLHRYPDGSGYLLINKLADTLGVSPGQIVLGNGSDDVIGMLARAYLRAGNDAVMTAPSFLMYEIFVQSIGATPVFVPLKSLAVDLDAMLSAITPRTRMIFLNNPNNPTGTFITRTAFNQFMSRLPDNIVVVLDEAYIEFAKDPECVNGLDWIQNNRPLAVLRTFSKIYGLAGIRVGYGVMSSEMASLLNRIRQPFNVNSLAQAAAIAAIDDDAFLNQTKNLIHEELAFMQAYVKRIGVEFFPTQANFFLIDVKGNADEVFDMMLREGVIVRSMVSYGFPRYIRVNAGLRKENIRFLNALEKVLKARKVIPR